MSASPVGNEVPPQDVPIPDSDEGLISEQVYLACHETGLHDDKGDELITFTHVETSEDFVGPPLAEDGLPFVTEPLCPDDHQAFCLEVPVKSKDIKKWLVESAPEQLVTLAAAGKRSRAEVSIKNLTKAEIALFDAAKQKEISCWIQTSAIAPILRRKLNPEQVLKSRWILTWKAPEEGESQPRAKARLVVLGFQDPKLVEVLRDAPTLSREGKADENNPLAMDPPPEFRRALNLKDSEVCQLLGNAYGRVD
ncbi:GIP, partial [Symbiodinium microadriaticum]